MGEQLMTITLNGSDLTVTQVVAAARHGETVALAPEAIAAMRRSRAVVQDVLARGEPVYGLTTGVGERKAYLLDPAERQRFNHRLVLNHRIAQGDVAPADVVRGAMICLANSYAKGVTGVRPELAEMIVTLLNEGFAPPVRRLGSLGQGDLGPMADLAHGLITRSGFEVAENEGLALVSSNAFTTAWACLATADAEALVAVFDAPGQARGLGLGTGRAYRMVRELVPFTQADGTLPADLEPLIELVTRGTLTPAA
jgi:histidine ammonia-lyase